jgi:hypothetical protein
MKYEYPPAALSIRQSSFGRQKAAGAAACLRAEVGPALFQTVRDDAEGGRLLSKSGRQRAGASQTVLLRGIQPEQLIALASTGE